MSLRLREMQVAKEIETENAQREEFEGRQWQLILKRWPQIRDHLGNFYTCRDACRPMDLTVDDLALLLEDESFVKELSLGEPDQQRLEYIEKICQKLNEMTDAPGVEQARRKKMVFWTLDQLRQELSRLENVAELHSKPISELRRIANSSRTVPGYPPLPREIVPQGRVKAVKLDANYIQKADPEQLRFLIRKYSADAVNARLRGE